MSILYIDWLRETSLNEKRNKNDLAVNEETAKNRVQLALNYWSVRASWAHLDKSENLLLIQSDASPKYGRLLIFRTILKCLIVYTGVQQVFNFFWSGVCCTFSWNFYLLNWRPPWIEVLGPVLVLHFLLCLQHTWQLSSIFFDKLLSWIYVLPVFCATHFY